MKKITISEADCCLFFELNPLPMWIYDRETLSFLIVNDAAVEHYGFTRAEFSAMKVTELLTAKDVAKFLARPASDYSDGKQGVWRLRKKDGTLIDVEINSRALVFAQRDARLILTQDVTEYNLVTAKLRESEMRLQALVGSIDELVLEFDAAGICLDLWTQDESLLIAPREKIIGRRLTDIFDEKLAAVFMETFGRVAASTQAECLDYNLNLEGGRRWFQARISLIPCVVSTRQTFCVLVRDITERKQAEEELKNKTRAIVTIWESMTDAFFAVDTQWRFSYVNSQAATLLGRTRDSLLGADLWEMFPEASDSKFGREYRRAMAESVKVDFEEFYSPLNTWFEVHAYPSDLGLSVYFRDVTQRKQTEAQLHFQKAVLEAQSEASLDGILIVSDAGRVLSYNQQLIQMWDIPEDVLKQRDDAQVLEFVSGKLVNPDEFREKIVYLYHARAQSREELALRDGRIIDRYSTPITGADGTYYGRVWYFRDITERKNAVEELHEINLKLGALAITDALTGLSNRRALDVGLQRELQRSKRHDKPLSLVLLDLDHFKNYNDAFGHLAGDKVLQIIGRLLREQARDVDLAARYGGEEFAVVLSDAGETEAMSMAERLRRSIETADWKERVVTASFGVATIRPNETDLTGLLAAADTALYHSKDRGRNRVTHYSQIAAANE